MLAKISDAALHILLFEDAYFILPDYPSYHTADLNIS